MIQQNYLPVCVSFITNYENVDKFKEKILKIAKVLSRSLGDQNLKVYLIEHNSNLKIFKEKCERKLTCILCKRFMIRIAIKIGELEGTNLIVTGDILGEQASQTLDNIYAYQSVLENACIIRPLIGFDKLDVLKINKKIGLYDLCSEKSDSCVHFPTYPETHAKLSEIKAAEKNLPLDTLIEDSFAKVELYEI